MLELLVVATQSYISACEIPRSVKDKVLFLKVALITVAEYLMSVPHY